MSRVTLPLLATVSFDPSSSPTPASPRRRSFTPESVVESDGAAPGLTQDVTHQLEEFLIAVSRLGEGRQRAGGQTASSLLLHQLMFSLLRLRELRGDDHQAQIDHEERADLDAETDRTLSSPVFTSVFTHYYTDKKQQLHKYT